MKPLSQRSILFLKRLPCWNAKRSQKLFFSNVNERLDIKRFLTNDFTHDPDISFIDMIEKFRNHPSIIKIKEAKSKGSTFQFTASEADILKQQQSF